MQKSKAQKLAASKTLASNPKLRRDCRRPWTKRNVGSAGRRELLEPLEPRTKLPKSSPRKATLPAARRTSPARSTRVQRTPAAHARPAPLAGRAAPPPEPERPKLRARAEPRRASPKNDNAMGEEQPPPQTRRRKPSRRATSSGARGRAAPWWPCVAFASWGDVQRGSCPSPVQTGRARHGSEFVACFLKHYELAVFSADDAGPWEDVPSLETCDEAVQKQLLAAIGEARGSQCKAITLSSTAFQ